MSKLYKYWVNKILIYCYKYVDYKTNMLFILYCNYIMVPTKYIMPMP